MKIEIIDEIQSDEKDLYYIQGLHYEVQTHIDIIGTLLQNHARDEDDSVLSSKAFLTYSKELAMKKGEYEMAKEAIAEKYLPEKYKESSDLFWEINFRSGVMEIKKGNK